MTVYDHLISKAREAGAHLAITKDFSRDQLIEHIRGLYHSNVLPPVTFSQTTNELLEEPLTEREVEVLTLMAEGLKDRQIAEKLVISVHTAKNYVAYVEQTGCRKPHTCCHLCPKKRFIIKPSNLIDCQIRIFGYGLFMKVSRLINKRDLV
jgi:hypothetical protein